MDYDYYDDSNPQQNIVAMLPIAVIAIALLLIFCLSQVDFSKAGSTGGTVISGGATTQGNQIAPLFTPEVQFWADSIATWSEQTGINANLIATVMQIESCGDPFARSSVGAMGLFQVMPYHFETGEDPYKPATNALRGLGYLQRALAERDGVIRLGLAGYNGGITGAKKPENAWPNETQRYVYWGTGIYEDAINGKARSDRLDEWLARGGTHLCVQAAQRLGIAP